MLQSKGRNRWTTQRSEHTQMQKSCLLLRARPVAALWSNGLLLRHAGRLGVASVGWEDNHGPHGCGRRFGRLLGLRRLLD